MTSEDPTATKITPPNKKPEQDLADIGDYSIYLPIDGIKQSAPWRLKDYGDEGALSSDDMAELKAEFDLPDDILYALSLQIGYCLDVESEVNLVKENRARALSRTQEPIEKAAFLAKRLEADIHKIRDLIDPLQSTFARNKEQAQTLRDTKMLVQAVFQASNGLYAAIDLLSKTPGAAAVMSPTDKRTVWDMRRKEVVEHCCRNWQDAGRPITFTTVSDGSKAEQRQGRLIDFVQAVVAKVTDPPSELPPETIRKDLDRFKKKLASPDELSIPPKQG